MYVCGMRHVYIRVLVCARMCVRVCACAYVCLSTHKIRYVCVCVCVILRRRACSFAWDKASPSFSIVLYLSLFLFSFFFLIIFIRAFEVHAITYILRIRVLRCFETRKVGVICAGIDNTSVLVLIRITGEYSVRKKRLCFSFNVNYISVHLDHRHGHNNFHTICFILFLNRRTWVNGDHVTRGERSRYARGDIFLSRTKNDSTLIKNIDDFCD